jgi:hypothetical protein
MGLEQTTPNGDTAAVWLSETLGRSLNRIDALLVSATV